MRFCDFVPRDFAVGRKKEDAVLRPLDVPQMELFVTLSFAVALPKQSFDTACVTPRDKDHSLQANCSRHQKSQSDRR